MRDPAQARHQERIAGWRALRFSGTRGMFRSAWRTMVDRKRPAAVPVASLDSRQQKRYRALATAFRQVSHPGVAGGEPRKNRRRMALKIMRKSWREA